MSNFCLSFVSEMSRNRYNRHPTRCDRPLGEATLLSLQLFGEATLLSLPALAKPSSEAARVPLLRWGEASRRAAPGEPHSRATAISPPAPLSPSAAINCGPPAWKAAILAALQPPALLHRISQSPPGRNGVPPPSGGARRPAEPPGRVTRPA